MQRTAQRPADNSVEPDPEPPYRLIPHPDPMIRGIRVAHTATARMAAQEWVQEHAGQGITNPIAAVDLGVKASTIAWELMDNAHKYSRSGLPGQTLDVTLRRLNDFLMTVAVTDAGALTLFDTRCSFPHQQEDGGGLRRVADRAFYWGWEGGVGFSCTVTATLELPWTSQLGILPTS